MPILPDILKPELKVVFCGTAAGKRSAQAGAYYAHPRNRFWAILHQIGLTPRRLQPSEFRLLLEYGIGLTDLAKEASGNDDEIAGGAFDVDGLRQKIADFAPHVVAFNGKMPAQFVFQARIEDYGRYTERLADSVVYVLPSTSPQNIASWDALPWASLAKYVQSLAADPDHR